MMNSRSRIFALACFTLLTGLLPQAELHAQQRASTLTIRATPLQPANSSVRGVFEVSAQENTVAIPDTTNELFASPASGPETSSIDAEESLEAQKKQARLQKIQRLTVDRRPSTILRTWSEPEPQPESEAEDPSDEPTETPSDSPTKPTEDQAAISISEDVLVKSELPPDFDPANLQQLEAARVTNATVTTTNTTVEDPEFDKFLERFQRAVTLGRWEQVGELLDSMEEDECDALYTRLLQVLPNAPRTSSTTITAEMLNAGVARAPIRVNPQFMEKNVIAHNDILALIRIAPLEIDEALISSLGRLVSLAVSQGKAIEGFLDAVQIERELPEEERILTDRQIARILIASGSIIESGSFLPTVEKAEEENDREALNLLSRYYIALNAKEQTAEYLERAWEVTQAVLAAGEVDEAEKTEALTRAVELAPRVREELGARWLEESFTERPERGMEIIAAIGRASSQGLQTKPRDPSFRLRALELQQQAVNALLKAMGEHASDWGGSLELLAIAWLAEAEHSQRYDRSTSLGPRMMRDTFGNIYYSRAFNDPNQVQMQSQNRNMPLALRTDEVLEVRPGEDWLSYVDDSLVPKFATVTAQLLLKVGEETDAFPFIEQLAESSAERATELAEEFLRVWTRNHDPDTARSYTNPYVFMYGYERRAESIPLTRSKQERNLKELTKWVDRLNQLQLEDLDETLLTRAFTACHSDAEVYRIDVLEEVFGSIDALEPKTLAMLVQQMRTNLASIWRLPATQENAKTRRRERDIRAEVMRGYGLAQDLVQEALVDHPGHYTLIQAGAAIAHDLNNYLQELEPDSTFTPKRREALGEFASAAEAYAQQVPDLKEEEESVEVYQQWFAASLGAVDLGGIKEEHQFAPQEPGLIREAIMALPGEAAQRHLDMFANALFTRLSAVSPSLKFRYLEAGFEVVGDHEQAREAKQVYDYYRDLVTEIKLDTHVDGTSNVGSGETFGLFVDLRHTLEIEREAGGFTRYLQNQNTGTSYYYNYGRPLENYRDKFEKATREALNEQFVVHSITFQSEKVNSRATEEYGWRVTPYAYVLLEARGPEVDTIPPLRIDLDFLDTSGYVILPIESPALPIDAGTRDEPRPYANLQITQTLDERQASEGRLILEVKAVAQGLVPDFEEMLDLDPEGFRIVQSKDKGNEEGGDSEPGPEDQGLSVSKFDEEADGNVVVTERSWIVTLEADDVESGIPANFQFASTTLDDAEVIYQRYDDADLVTVSSLVDLEEQYGERNLAAVWWSLGGLVLVGVVILVVMTRPKQEIVEVEKFQLPEPMTPFTVLGLLREIERVNGFPAPQHQELVSTISRIENHYFLGDNSPDPDLRAVATEWIARSR